MNNNRYMMNIAAARALQAMREYDWENGRKYAAKVVEYCQRLQDEGQARPSEVEVVNNMAKRAGIDGWIKPIGFDAWAA